MGMQVHVGHIGIKLTIDFAFSSEVTKNLHSVLRSIDSESSAHYMVQSIHSKDPSICGTAVGLKCL